jgi:hypothetical protein
LSCCVSGSVAEASKDIPRGQLHARMLATTRAESA